MRIVEWWREQDWHAMRPQWRWLVGPGLVLVGVIGVVTGLLIDRNLRSAGDAAIRSDAVTTTSSAPAPALGACERTGYSRKSFGNEPTTATRTALAHLSANVDGTLTDPYTGLALELDEADADHVVPLAYAWDHGACRWPAPLRVRFAADLGNLKLTDASLNRSKGDRGPDEWLPTVGACAYWQTFARVSTEYRLIPDAAVDAAAERACP